MGKKAHWGDGEKQGGGRVLEQKRTAKANLGSGLFAL